MASYRFLLSVILSFLIVFTTVFCQNPVQKQVTPATEIGTSDPRNSTITLSTGKFNVNESPNKGAVTGTGEISTAVEVKNNSINSPSHPGGHMPVTVSSYTTSSNKTTNSTNSVPGGNGTTTPIPEPNHGTFSLAWYWWFLIIIVFIVLAAFAGIYFYNK